MVKYLDRRREREQTYWNSHWTTDVKRFFSSWIVLLWTIDYCHPYTSSTPYFESLSLYYKTFSLIEYIIAVFQSDIWQMRAMPAAAPQSAVARLLALSSSADDVNVCLSVSCECCTLFSLCVGLITRPGKTYRLSMCPVSVSRCYINF
jgi:hypothetical protein